MVSGTLLPLLTLLLVSFTCSQNPPLGLIFLTEDDLPGNQALLVAESAVRDINNSSDLLPAHQLHLLREESGCDNSFSFAPYQMAQVLHEELSDREEEGTVLVGVIGPTCSRSALLLGYLLRQSLVTLPNIHLATSSRLENHAEYPNSFGIAGSSSWLLRTAIELARVYNWSVVSVLYDESGLYHSSALYNLEEELRENITVNEYFMSAVHPSYTPLAELKRESRIVFLFTSEEFLRRVLCMGYHVDLVFPAYQYVLARGSSHTLLRESVSYVSENQGHANLSCSVEELAIALSGALLLNFHHTPAQPYNRNDEILTLPISLRSEQQYLAATNPSLPFYYDAIWLLALALNASAEGGLDRPSLEVIQRELFEVEFMGASGHVQFSNVRGFAKRNVSVHQYTERGLTLLSTYDTVNSRLVVETTAAEILPARIRENRVVRTILPRALEYISIILTSLLLLFLVTLHILVLVYRNRKTMKASSVKVLQLAFMGSYMLVLSVFSHILIDSFSESYMIVARCHLWHVLNTSLAVGLALISSTLCVRTWRLYRIFVYFKNPGKCLSDRALVVVSLLCSSVIALIGLLWFLIDPVSPVLFDFVGKLSILKHSNNTVSGVEITLDVHCLSVSSFLLWLLLQHLSNLFFMLALGVLVYLTRNITQKDFSTVGILHLNYIMVCGGLLLMYVYTVLLFSPDSDVNRPIRFTIFVAMLNLINVSVCLLLYLPPLLPVLKTKLGDSHGRRFFSSNTTS